MKKLREWIENGEEWIKVLGGDFNIRTGRKGGEWERKGEKGKEKGGRGMGRLIGKEGNCVVFLRELGWSILNGNVEGDEGEWTYTREKGDRSSIMFWEMKSQGRGKMNEG